MLATATPFGSSQVELSIHGLKSVISMTDASALSDDLNKIIQEQLLESLAHEMKVPASIRTAGYKLRWAAYYQQIKALDIVLATHSEHKVWKDFDPNSTPIGETKTWREILKGDIG